MGEENLTVAMLSVTPVLALGAIFFLLGSRYLPRDQENVQRTGGEAASGPVMFH